MKTLLYKNSTKTYQVYQEIDKNNEVWVVAYSYNAPIALVHADTGELHLTNWTDYSITTQKHFRHFFFRFVNIYQYQTTFGKPLVQQLKKLDHVQYANLYRAPVFEM